MTTAKLPSQLAESPLVWALEAVRLGWAGVNGM